MNAYVKLINGIALTILINSCTTVDRGHGETDIKDKVVLTHAELEELESVKWFEGIEKGRKIERESMRDENEERAFKQFTTIMTSSMLTSELLEIPYVPQVKTGPVDEDEGNN